MSDENKQPEEVKQPTFVDLEEYYQKEAEKQAEKEAKKTKQLTPTEYAIQSMAVAFIKIAQALERIATALENKPVKFTGQIPTSTPKTPEKPKPVTNWYKNSFPEELSSLLDFRLQGDIVYIKPVKFLGAENFAKIASIVKELGGKYVSAGKNSHFEIPTPKPQ